MDVGAVEAPQESEESRNASGHDNRSRHREVSFPGSRHRRGRQCNRQAAIEAPSYPHVLSKAAVVPGWYRSLRIITPLVARDQSAWPHGPPDATCLCEALRQATEERCDGRRGNLRGSEATDDARACRVNEIAPISGVM